MFHLNLVKMEREQGVGVEDFPERSPASSLNVTIKSDSPSDWEREMRLFTFFLEVQDDGGVDGGHGEVGEGPVLQLHVQSDGAQMRLPAQRPHGLNNRKKPLSASVCDAFQLHSARSI